MRGLAIGRSALSVRMIASFRVATPANALSRTRWIDVFFASSRSGPRARAAFRMAWYVRATDVDDLAKWDATLGAGWVARERLENGMDVGVMHNERKY